MKNREPLWDAIKNIGYDNDERSDIRAIWRASGDHATFARDLSYPMPELLARVAVVLCEDADGELLAEAFVRITERMRERLTSDTAGELDRVNAMERKAPSGLSYICMQLANGLLAGRAGYRPLAVSSIRVSTTAIRASSALLPAADASS